MDLTKSIYSMDTKNKIISVSGIIVKTEDTKEYDKKITIVSSELGKINFFAFGVKKQNSKNIAKTNIFVFGKFDLKLTKDIYSLDNITVINYFNNLTLDITNYYYGNYFLELINYFSFENNSSKEILFLIVNALNSLIKNKMDKKLIRRVFELKLLSLEGFARTSDLLNKNTSDTVKFTWNYIYNQDVYNLFNFNIEKKYFDEFDFLVKKELDMNINYHFKSLDFI